MNLQRSEDGDGMMPENTLPLINIVFLLLTFFMVAGALERSDFFEVTPPQSRSEQAAPEGGPLLLVGAGGKMALNDTPVSDKKIGEAILPLLGEGKLVRLKADANADAADVVRLMDLLRQVGVEKVSLITVEQ